MESHAGVEGTPNKHAEKPIVEWDEDDVYTWALGIFYNDTITPTDLITPSNRLSRAQIHAKKFIEQEIDGQALLNLAQLIRTPVPHGGLTSQYSIGSDLFCKLNLPVGPAAKLLKVLWEIAEWEQESEQEEDVTTKSDTKMPSTSYNLFDLVRFPKKKEKEKNITTDAKKKHSIASVDFLFKNKEKQEKPHDLISDLSKSGRIDLEQLESSGEIEAAKKEMTPITEPKSILKSDKSASTTPEKPEPRGLKRKLNETFTGMTGKKKKDKDQILPLAKLPSGPINIAKIIDKPDLQQTKLRYWIVCAMYCCLSLNFEDKNGTPAAYLQEIIKTTPDLSAVKGIKKLAAIDQKYSKRIHPFGIAELQRFEKPDGETIVVFLRGTKNREDVFKDLKFLSKSCKKAGGTVHSGFYTFIKFHDYYILFTSSSLFLSPGFLERAQTIPMHYFRNFLLQKKGTIIITGHSLGGAVAQILTQILLLSLPTGDYRLRCITFGQPLVGDVHVRNKLRAWRDYFIAFIHENDPVPKLGSPSSVANLITRSVSRLAYQANTPSTIVSNFLFILF